MSVGCGLDSDLSAFLSLRNGLGVGEATLSRGLLHHHRRPFPAAPRPRLELLRHGPISIGAGIAQLVGGLVVGFVQGRDT